jgi:O-antigen/teichoic acid export membrane protein
MNSGTIKIKFFKILGMQILMEFSLRVKSILIIPILISRLGFADYGKYALMLTLVSLVSAAASFGIRESLLRFNADELNYQRVDSIFRRSLYTTIAVYSITSSTILTCYFSFSNKIDVGFFPYIFTYGLLVELVAVFNTHLRAIGKFRFYYYVNFLDVFLNLIFIFVALQQTKFDLRLILVAMVGSSILVLALGVFLIKSSGTGFTPISFMSRDMYLFATPLALNGILMWVTNGADKLILSEMVPAETLGHYSLAYTLGLMSVSVTASGVFMLAPRVLFNSNQSHWQAKEIRFASQTMSLLTVSTFAFLTVLKFAQHIIERYFPPLNWNEFLSVAYIVGISYLFLYLGDHLRYILFHNRITRYEPFILGASALSNVVLNLLLIPNYGIIGAAWSTFLSILVQPILIMVMLRVRDLQVYFLEVSMVLSAVSVVCFSLIYWNTNNIISISIFIVFATLFFYYFTSSLTNPELKPKRPSFKREGK